MTENEDLKTHDLLRMSENDFDKFLEDDDNPPIFYKPKAVTKIAKWLYRLSSLSIIVVALMSIEMLLDIREGAWHLAELFSISSTMAWMLNISVQFLLIAIRFFFYYFGFRAIASALVVLMEMELNSRKSSS